MEDSNDNDDCSYLIDTVTVLPGIQRPERLQLWRVQHKTERL